MVVDTPKQQVTFRAGADVLMARKSDGEFKIEAFRMAAAEGITLEKSSGVGALARELSAV